MSTVTVMVPPSLRQFVGGHSSVPVDAVTVRGALDALAIGSEPLRGHLFDRDNEINRFVRVFLDGSPIRPRGQDETRDGAVVTILLALAGG